MAEEVKFTMTGTTLAKAVASAAKRERTRCANLVDDAANVALGQGEMELAKALTIVAESVRSVSAPAAPEPEPEVEERELPDVHHMDDFAEGIALVGMGAHRRGVVGYNGATGNLRD